MKKTVIALAALLCGLSILSANPVTLEEEVKPKPIILKQTLTKAQGEALLATLFVLPNPQDISRVHSVTAIKAGEIFQVRVVIAAPQPTPAP